MVQHRGHKDKSATRRTKVCWEAVAIIFCDLIQKHNLLVFLWASVFRHPTPTSMLTSIIVDAAKEGRDVPAVFGQIVDSQR